MQISVLFVPFDAAIQHYKRNAQRGVTGYTMEKDPDARVGDKRKRGDEVVEATGIPIDFTQKRHRLNDQDAALTCILESAYDQAQKNQAAPYHPYTGSSADVGRTKASYGKAIKRKMTALFPDLLLLSEQPTGLEFSKTIKLTNEITLAVTYRLLGTAGSLAVQRIYGYVRDDLAGSWSAKELVKTSSGQAEKLLTISGDINGAKICVAGVHLTSKNVAIRTGTPKYETTVKELSKFCSDNKIDVAIGDFNLDTRAATSAPGTGGIGVLPNSTIYLAQYTAPTVGVQWQEQFSNSSNEKHFMGCMVMDTKRVFLPSNRLLSLERSVDASGTREYHSDHPPIYAELDVLG